MNDHRWFFVPPTSLSLSLCVQVFGSEKDCLRLNIFAPSPSASLQWEEEHGGVTPDGAEDGGHHRRALRGMRQLGGGGGAEGGHEVMVPPRPGALEGLTETPTNPPESLLALS
jgi:hypothetical protein